MLNLNLSVMLFLITPCLLTPQLAWGAEDGADEDRLRALAKNLPMLGPKLMVGEAMLFDFQTGKLLKTHRRYGGNLRHVRFSPDDTHALLSYYDISVLWNIDTGEVVREFGHGGIAGFSPDGSEVLIYEELEAHRYQVASGEHLETIHLLTLPSRGFKGRHTRINAHLQNEVQRDSSGKFLYNVQPNGTQPILEAATGKVVGECPRNQGGCFVAGESRQVLVGGPLHPQGVVQVFDFHRQEVARFDMPSGEVPALGGRLMAVSPDGKQFLYAHPVKGGGVDSGPNPQHRTIECVLYDAQTGKELKKIGRYDAHYTASISPDGERTLLVPTFAHEGTDTRDPAILVINNATGAVDHRLYTGPWALPSIDFDTSGNHLLVAGSIDFNHWRRFGEWRLLEQRTPMPRKVRDALEVLEEWQGRGK